MDHYSKRGRKHFTAVRKIDHVVKMTATWTASYSAVRPLIRRGIIDIYYLAAGIFTGNFKKTGKSVKNRFFLNFIEQYCTTPHSTRNHRFILASRRYFYRKLEETQ